MPRTGRVVRVDRGVRSALRTVAPPSVRRLCVAGLALLLGVVGWTPPVSASRVPHGSSHVTLLTPPTPGPVDGHLLAISSLSSKVSTWVATDLTKLEATVDVTGDVSVAKTPDGTVEVAGRTPADELVVFSSHGAKGAKGWSVLDVTSLAKAPVSASPPSIVVDTSGVTRVFYRTQMGDLEEIENDRHTSSDPWFSSDLTGLTNVTQSPSIAGSPVALVAPGYPTEVFARATDGALVSFTLTTIRLHPWYYENVSELSLGPTITGTPSVVAAPDGFGLTAVFAVSSSGHLVEFTDDDVGFHLWSARDVSTKLGLPPVGSSPTVLAGLPTDVTTVSSSGHVLVVTIPTVSLAGASFKDLSALVRLRVVPGTVASIAEGPTGYVVAAKALSRHVVVFSAPTTTSTHVTVSDATMQPLTEQVAGDDPVPVDVDGSMTLFVASGGFIGLSARIVLISESQDQFHAKVIDTPESTDCNPFTANYDRGSTADCVPGTASEEWCSDFAEWVWSVAGIDTTGIDGASKTFVTWGEARGQFLKGMKTTPKVGDAVVWGTLSPLWGAHVGLVVAVKGRQIKVVSGNAGGYANTSGVWDSGFFLPASQTAQGDPIIGYVSPVPLGTSKPAPPPAQWPRAAAWPVVQGAGSQGAPTG